MGKIRRLERNIEKLEKKIEKEQLKIENLLMKCDNKKITKADYNIKREHIEEKIHVMKSEIGGLHGDVAKTKRRLEEKKKKS